MKPPQFPCSNNSGIFPFMDLTSLEFEWSSSIHWHQTFTLQIINLWHFYLKIWIQNISSSSCNSNDSLVIIRSFQFTFFQWWILSISKQSLINSFRVNYKMYRRVLLTCDGRWTEYALYAGITVSYWGYFETGGWVWVMVAAMRWLLHHVVPHSRNTSRRRTTLALNYHIHLNF